MLKLLLHCTATATKPHTNADDFGFWRTNVSGETPLPTKDDAMCVLVFKVASIANYRPAIVLMFYSQLPRAVLFPNISKKDFFTFLYN